MIQVYPSVLQALQAFTVNVGCCLSESCSTVFLINNILTGMHSAFVIHFIISLHVGRLIGTVLYCTVISSPAMSCPVLYCTALY
jgi:hypothetical protein